MKKQAFTIVELLVVVMIIGILVSMAIPNYRKSVERSIYAQGMANLDTVRKCELSYYSRNLQYFPVTDQTTLNTLATQLNAQILNTVEWTYTVASPGQTFIATATRLRGPTPGTVTVTDNGTPGGTYVAP